MLSFKAADNLRIGGQSRPAGRIQSRTSVRTSFKIMSSSMFGLRPCLQWRHDDRKYSKDYIVSIVEEPGLDVIQTIAIEFDSQGRKRRDALGNG